MINLLGRFVLLDWLWLIILMVILIAFIVIICIMVPLKLWFRALTSGAKVSMIKLIGLKQRKVNVYTIVEAYISAKKAGLYVEIDELEAHNMAGGDVNKVINALISANSAKIDLSLDTAKAIDLAGKDVFEVVKSSVTPKVIETGAISAIVKDGMEVKVKARVTVRANISKILGGTGEETIIAKVTEGIVATIGGYSDHKDVLQNPDLISKAVLSKNLDKGSAYEVLSVDISNIDIGRNIGAQLRMDQAETEKQIASAKAEERRFNAIAEEQEMRVKAQEMSAAKIAAEAEVPKAVVKAFEEGKINVIDYYKMQNIIADTNMRKAIAKDSDDED